MRTCPIGEPVVVLNTYKENDPIYDYYKINNS